MTEAPISRLRQRMIEDMTIRKFAPRTQEGYSRAVKGSAPSSAPRRIERVSRIYVAISLHLVASGAGSPTINHTVTALRFLFIVTLRKPRVVIRLPSNADGTGNSEPQAPSHSCPCCGGRMIIVETFERGCTPRYRHTVPSRIDSS